MAFGLEAFKDDGSILFETERICYGLVKSGYLQLVDRWGRFYIRSANLDPGRQDSYTYRDFRDPICGITVTDTMSPIVFLSGDGKPCGESVVGNTRTLYFQGCKPNTKAYVFDLMRDVGETTGMNIYNQSGTLTFTTGMPPLNIIATVDPPPLSAPVSPGTSYQWTPYVGSSNEPSGQEWASSDFSQIKGAVFVPVAGGELAAHLTFSRSCALQEGSDVQGNTGLFALGASEGCGGGIGGIRFFFSSSVSTIAEYNSNSRTLWSSIPTDRQPQALVIRTSDYPFPFK
jgi:hypothetical protein